MLSSQAKCNIWLWSWQLYYGCTNSFVRVMLIVSALEVPLRELLIAAAERAIRYLEGLNGRGVAPDPTVVARLAELNIPLPDHPSPADETLALLDSYGAATMAMAGPRFFGFVVGGALPATLAANWLAGTWDQNTSSGRGHPIYREAGGRCAPVAPRCARLAARNGCGVRHWRDGGEFHLPGRSAP